MVRSGAGGSKDPQNTLSSRDALRRLHPPHMDTSPHRAGPWPGHTVCHMNSNLATRTRVLLALPIAAVAFSLAACSGGSERPSTGELSDGISTILEDAGQGGILTDDQLECVAEAFLDSDVSDQDLANLAAGKDEQTTEEAKTLVTETMSEAGAACAG